MNEIKQYTKEDFTSNQEVRWCPGCGDYSILATMQRTLANFQVPPEKHVFISGIGCSSRFPYYMNTYGFHTIHGRAPTVATGLRCVNPDLTIWVITGDGDGLSIGGNHLIHCLRRNMNLKILLVNNQIYGLTKGQYSPTSVLGKVTKSTPMGSIDYPINALSLGVASEATFIARTMDSDPAHMAYVLERAMKHQGSAFVEIYQNCIIFNDKTFAGVIGREVRQDHVVFLEDGKPLIFGKNRDRAITIKGMKPEVVPYTSDAVPAGLTIHDEKDAPQHYSYFLSQMNAPELPVPFGVFRAVSRPTYDGMMQDQVNSAIQARGAGELQKLIYGNATWKVS